MQLTGEAKTLIGVGIVTVLLLVGGVFFLSGSSSGPTDSSTPIDQSTLIKEDTHKIMGDQAKVTIVEFLDYECEACGAAHPIVKQVLNEYQGKVNFAVRNFPNHFNSLAAANAVEAAGEQGKYWEMHNLMFERQTQWSEQRTLQDDKFKAFAQELGLNMEQFNTSFDSRKYSDKINQDKTEATNLGVNATPTFFINGKKEVGVLSYEQWKSKIEAELKN